MLSPEALVTHCQVLTLPRRPLPRRRACSHCFQCGAFPAPPCVPCWSSSCLAPPCPAVPWRLRGTAPHTSRPAFTHASAQGARMCPLAPRTVTWRVHTSTAAPYRGSYMSCAGAAPTTVATHACGSSRPTGGSRQRRQRRQQQQRGRRGKQQQGQERRRHQGQGQEQGLEQSLRWQ